MRPNGFDRTRNRRISATAGKFCLEQSVIVASMQAICHEDTINDIENWREWWKEYKRDAKYWKDKKKEKKEG